MSEQADSCLHINKANERSSLRKSAKALLDCEAGRAHFGLIHAVLQATEVKRLL